MFDTVTDFQLLEWAITTGGPLTALTIMMFLISRRDSQKNAIDQQKNADQWRGQSDVLIGVVKENTVAITSLTTMIREERRG